MRTSAGLTAVRVVLLGCVVATTLGFVHGPGRPGFHKNLFRFTAAERGVTFPNTHDTPSFGNNGNDDADGGSDRAQIRRAIAANLTGAGAAVVDGGGFQFGGSRSRRHHPSSSRRGSSAFGVVTWPATLRSGSGSGSSRWSSSSKRYDDPTGAVGSSPARRYAPPRQSSATSYSSDEDGSVTPYRLVRSAVHAAP